MTHDPNFIQHLDAAGLRRFGLTMAIAVAVIFGALLPFLFDRAIPYWPFLLAGALLAWSVAVPQTLNLIYRPWMRLGLIMNRITSPIIMGVVFFLIITPVSLLMKLIRRDPLARGFDQSLKSYRKESRKPPRAGLERPF
jgi:hypothetical protein